MAAPSPFRAAVRTLPLVGGIAAFFGVLVLLNGDRRAALAVTVVTVLVVTPVVGQAPARLAWRLRELAGQVPGDPESSIAWHGDQTLEWPDLALTVEGRISRYRLQQLTVHADTTTLRFSPTRPREAARTALAELDHEPAVTAPSDRHPSLYPRLAGLKTATVATVLAGIAVGLGGPLVADGVYPLWWWGVVPLAGIGAGVLRWAGLAQTRGAMQALVSDLRDAGTPVRAIDRTDGVVRLQFVVHTATGDVPVRCPAVPYGPIAASRPADHGETVRARLADPTPLADQVATWLRHRTAPATGGSP